MRSPRSGKAVDRPIVWSFFSGAMGLDIGFAEGGLKPSLATDHDPWCCETIRANEPGMVVLEKDVAEITAHTLREAAGPRTDIDVMIGGPPCQSFCPGGKRAALSDPRGNLIYEYFRLIEAIRPRYFVFENVANLVTAALRHRPIKDRPGKMWNLSSYAGRNIGDEGADALAPDEQSGTAIRQLLQDIGSIGYKMVFGILDAADYGAPQHRLRFVMIGARDGEPPGLPAPTHGTRERLLPFRTVRDAIGDLVDAPGPGSEYTPEVRRWFELIPPGGNWRDLPRELQREALGERSFVAGGGKTGFFRRLHWDRPSPTITGKANRKGSALCHPEATRPLSVRECARLQGFPDHWKVQGGTAPQYQQVGNAVPTHLGTAIARALLVHLSARTAPVQASFNLGLPTQNTEELLQIAVKRLRSAATNKRGGGAKGELLAV